MNSEYTSRRKPKNRYVLFDKAERICYPNGSSTVYEYEKGGRLKSVRYPDGAGEHYGYDARGNLTERTTTAGECYKYSYDCLARITSIENPAGGVAYFTYDALGRVTKAEDEKGNVTCYEYTPNGNLAKVTDALGNETFYQYDAMGQLVQTSCTGTNGEEPQNTVYTWDKEGHVTTVTDPLGDIERYTYDPAGKMRAKVDKDGYETAFHYGTNGQVEEICYADGRKVSLTYNAIRQLEEVKDWLGTTKIAMDEAGRIASVTDPYGKTVGYEWGSMGERTAVLYPDGKKNVYEYNEAMQMSAMKIFSGEMRENTIRYSYDEFGRLIGKQLPGGNYTDYRYNAAGKLEDILHKGADFTERCHYSYDVMGNKVMAEKERPGLPEDSGSFSYCYDALNRLTTVAQNGQTLRTYSYDAFGNRSSKTEYQTAGGLVTTYRYNTRNQLLQETNANGTKDYAYDHRGNLLSVTSGEEVLRAYGFDAANQMNSSMGMTDGQIKKAVYQYNGLGHRMEQSIAAGDAAPEQTIRYTLDLTRQYHNLLQRTENNVEQTYFWDGNVTGMEEEGREHFYFQDDLGSPMRLADEAGRSEETYGFDEFGNDIRTAKDIFKDSLQNFGFTGYQMDSAGGLYFAQARRYDAGVGRFVSEDFIRGHIAVPYTMNHYNYCWNRPMDLVDLNGMWPQLPDYLIEGNEAHRLLQAKFMSEISGGQVEYRITSSIASNPSGTGRADIVYFNSLTKTVEVYEIKPGSYTPGAINYAAGQSQLQGYIEALNRNGQIINGWKAAKGISLNSYFNTVIIPSVEYPDKEIVYHVYENGLINYYYRKKKTQEKPATSSEKVKEQEKDYSGLERIGIFAFGSALFLGAAVLFVDDIFGGVGVADDGIAMSAASAAVAFWGIAFTGKKRDNSCSMN